MVDRPSLEEEQKKKDDPSANQSAKKLGVGASNGHDSAGSNDNGHKDSDNLFAADPDKALGRLRADGPFGGKASTDRFAEDDLDDEPRSLAADIWLAQVERKSPKFDDVAELDEASQQKWEQVKKYAIADPKAIRAADLDEINNLINGYTDSVSEAAKKRVFDPDINKGSLNDVKNFRTLSDLDPAGASRPYPAGLRNSNGKPVYLPEDLQRCLLSNLSFENPDDDVSIKTADGKTVKMPLINLELALKAGIKLDDRMFLQAHRQVFKQLDSILKDADKLKQLNLSKLEVGALRERYEEAKSAIEAFKKTPATKDNKAKEEEAAVEAESHEITPEEVKSMPKAELKARFVSKDPNDLAVKEIMKEVFGTAASVPITGEDWLRWRTPLQANPANPEERKEAEYEELRQFVQEKLKAGETPAQGEGGRDFSKIDLKDYSPERIARAIMARRGKSAEDDALAGIVKTYMDKFAKERIKPHGYDVQSQQSLGRGRPVDPVGTQLIIDVYNKMHGKKVDLAGALKLINDYKAKSVAGNPTAGRNATPTNADTAEPTDDADTAQTKAASKADSKAEKVKDEKNTDSDTTKDVKDKSDNGAEGRMPKAKDDEGPEKDVVNEGAVGGDKSDANKTTQEFVPPSKDLISKLAKLKKDSGVNEDQDAEVQLAAYQRVLNAFERDKLGNVIPEKRKELRETLNAVLGYYSKMYPQKGIEPAEGSADAELYKPIEDIVFEAALIEKREELNWSIMDYAVGGIATVGSLLKGLGAARAANAAFTLIEKVPFPGLARFAFGTVPKWLTMPSRIPEDLVGRPLIRGLGTGGLSRNDDNRRIKWFENTAANWPVVESKWILDTHKYREIQKAREAGPHAELALFMRDFTAYAKERGVDMSHEESANNGKNWQAMARLMRRFTIEGNWDRNTYWDYEKSVGILGDYIPRVSSLPLPFAWRGVYTYPMLTEDGRKLVRQAVINAYAEADERVKHHRNKSLYLDIKRKEGVPKKELQEMSSSPAAYIDHVTDVAVRREIASSEQASRIRTTEIQAKNSKADEATKVKREANENLDKVSTVALKINNEAKASIDKVKKEAVSIAGKANTALAETRQKAAQVKEGVLKDLGAVAERAGKVKEELAKEVNEIDEARKTTDSVTKKAVQLDQKVRDGVLSGGEPPKTFVDYIAPLQKVVDDTTASTENRAACRVLIQEAKEAQKVSSDFGKHTQFTEIKNFDTYDRCVNTILPDTPARKFLLAESAEQAKGLKFPKFYEQKINPNASEKIIENRNFSTYSKLADNRLSAADAASAERTAVRLVQRDLTRENKGERNYNNFVARVGSDQFASQFTGFDYSRALERRRAADPSLETACKLVEAEAKAVIGPTYTNVDAMGLPFISNRRNSLQEMAIEKFAKFSAASASMNAEQQVKSFAPYQTGAEFVAAVDNVVAAETNGKSAKVKEAKEQAAELLHRAAEPNAQSGQTGLPILAANENQLPTEVDALVRYSDWSKAVDNVKVPKPSNSGTTSATSASAATAQAALTKQYSQACDLLKAVGSAAQNRTSVTYTADPYTFVPIVNSNPEKVTNFLQMSDSALLERLGKSGNYKDFRESVKALRNANGTSTEYKALCDLVLTEATAAEKTKVSFGDFAQADCQQGRVSNLGEAAAYYRQRATDLGKSIKAETNTEKREGYRRQQDAYETLARKAAEEQAKAEKVADSSTFRTVRGEIGNSYISSKIMTWDDLLEYDKQAITELDAKIAIVGDAADAAIYTAQKEKHQQRIETATREKERSPEGESTKTLADFISPEKTDLFPKFDSWEAVREYADKQYDATDNGNNAATSTLNEAWKNVRDYADAQLDKPDLQDRQPVEQYLWLEKPSGDKKTAGTGKVKEWLPTIRKIDMPDPANKGTPKEKEGRLEALINKFKELKNPDHAKQEEMAKEFRETFFAVALDRLQKKARVTVSANGPLYGRENKGVSSPKQNAKGQTLGLLDSWYRDLKIALSSVESKEKHNEAAINAIQSELDQTLTGVKANIENPKLRIDRVLEFAAGKIEEPALIASGVEYDRDSDRDRDNYDDEGDRRDRRDRGDDRGRNRDRNRERADDSRAADPTTRAATPPPGDPTARAAAPPPTDPPATTVDGGGGNGTRQSDDPARAVGAGDDTTLPAEPGADARGRETTDASRYGDLMDKLEQARTDKEAALLAERTILEATIADYMPEKANEPGQSFYDILGRHIVAISDKTLRNASRLGMMKGVAVDNLMQTVAGMAQQARASGTPASEFLKDKVKQSDLAAELSAKQAKHDQAAAAKSVEKEETKVPARGLADAPDISAEIKTLIALGKPQRLEETELDLAEYMFTEAARRYLRDRGQLGQANTREANEAYKSALGVHLGNVLKDMKAAISQPGTGLSTSESEQLGEALTTKANIFAGRAEDVSLRTALSERVGGQANLEKLDQAVRNKLADRSAARAAAKGENPTDRQNSDPTTRRPVQQSTNGGDTHNAKADRHPAAADYSVIAEDLHLALELDANDPDRISTDDKDSLVHQLEAKATETQVPAEKSAWMDLANVIRNSEGDLTAVLNKTVAKPGAAIGGTTQPATTQMPAKPPAGTTADVHDQNPEAARPDGVGTADRWIPSIEVVRNPEQVDKTIASVIEHRKNVDRTQPPEFSALIGEVNRVAYARANYLVANQYPPGTDFSSPALCAELADKYVAAMQQAVAEVNTALDKVHYNEVSHLQDACKSLIGHSNLGGGVMGTLKPKDIKGQPKAATITAADYARNKTGVPLSDYSEYENFKKAVRKGVGTMVTRLNSDGTWEKIPGSVRSPDGAADYVRFMKDKQLVANDPARPAIDALIERIRNGDKDAYREMIGREAKFLPYEIKTPVPAQTTAADGGNDANLPPEPARQQPGLHLLIENLKTLSQQGKHAEAAALAVGQLYVNTAYSIDQARDKFPTDESYQAELKTQSAQITRPVLLDGQISSDTKNAIFKALSVEVKNKAETAATKIRDQMPKTERGGVQFTGSPADMLAIDIPGTNMQSEANGAEPLLTAADLTRATNEDGADGNEEPPLPEHKIEGDSATAPYKPRLDAHGQLYLEVQGPDGEKFEFRMASLAELAKLEAESVARDLAKVGDKPATEVEALRARLADAKAIQEGLSKPVNSPEFASAMQKAKSSSHIADRAVEHARTNKVTRARAFEHAKTEGAHGRGGVAESARGRGATILTKLEQFMNSPAFETFLRAALKAF